MSEGNGSPDTGRKIDAWLAQARPEDVEVPLCLNRELLTEFEATMRQFETADAARKARAAKYGEAGGVLDEEDPAEAISRRLVEIHAEIEADKAEHVFRFRKMGYAEYRLIMEANPPTEAQRALSPFADHDAHGAAPALVAGSCIHPKMEIADAEALRETLPESAWRDLYDGAMRVNRTGVQIPKSVSSTVAQLASALRSTTAPDGASPSHSSADA